MTTELQRVVVDRAVDLVRPLTAAAASPEALGRFLDTIGWDLAAIAGLSSDEVSRALTACKEAVDDVEQLLETGLEDLGSLTDALVAVAAAVKEVSALADRWNPASASDLPPDVMYAFVEDLLAFLLDQHLTSAMPRVRAALGTTGVVDVVAVPAIARADGRVVRRAQPRPRWNVSLLERTLTDPVGLLRERYAYAGSARRDADAISDLAGPYVADALRQTGLAAAYGTPGAQEDRNLTPDEKAAAARLLHVALVYRSAEPGVDLAMLGLMLALGEVAGGLALAVHPFGELDISATAGDWTLRVGLEGTLGPFVVTAAGVDFRGAADAHLRQTFSAELAARTPGQPLVRLGSATGTRLDVAGLKVTQELDARPAGASLGAAIEPQGVRLAIAGGDGDGFLAKVLPSEPIVIDLPFALDWSTQHGFHVRGKERFEVDLPIQLALGPVTVASLRVALAGADGATAIELSATANLQLGPVAAAVERMGIEARVRSAAAGGSLGPVDLAVRFKPPNGVGLSIDAGAVTGGGFLFHDEAKALYAGALHLEFEGISLNAVGLLTTRMPDGSTGFSLLVIVTAAGFTPIQLGFGFTLTGVGGLLGLNRTVAVDVLRAGLKSHSLDSILFAEDDPTPRAAEIVSTLQSVFPPAPARYLFGSMAQIGWGTPTLVTLEIALLLELPAPLRLIILGRLRAVLPDEQAAVVRISLDVLGVIDFDARTVAVDGTLYDSFVGPFTLTGDLALRAGWGDPPAFALSIGGFHPAFRPPAGFPALRRLTLTLSSGDNPRLRAELYLAVTSNTVQVGARLEFHYEAFGFALDGLFAFDALVNLAPFGFEVDIVAHLAILRGRTTLMGVDVRITLTGPTPWRARGEAKFQVLFWDVSIPFDVTFGDTRAVPPPERVEVWPLLRDAIRDGRNWSALLPEESGRLVTLGAPPPAAGEALVHPYGQVAFAQRLLPLDRQLDLYGPAPPKDFGRFSITGVVSAQVAGARYDYFAPGQFTRLSDQEKLTRPSYERMPAGVELAGTGVRNGTEKPVPLSYETVVVAADGSAPAPVPAPLPGPALAASSFYVPDETTVAAHAEFGPAGNADTRHTGRQMFRAPGDPAVLDEPVYTVATRKDLARVPTTRPQDGSYSSALEALQEHLSEHPDTEGDLQVVLEHEAA